MAPRAPENDWNMWFKPYMPYFYDELIQSAVAVMGVNPDKVYLTGYSAGGDGLYRIAPLMADRFASAAMMAGHPGDSSPLSLYNLPFALWMGANDDAYSRNFHAKEWGSMLDSLQLLYSTTDNLKFIHDVHIVEDKGHWMDRADTVAINWMSQFVRDSSPETIMWKNDNDLTPEYFYWAAIKDPSQRKNSLVVITRESNTFTIEKCSSDTLTIYLKDEIADLNKPVKVIFNNEIIFDSKVKRTISNIYESINERGDRNYIFSARIDLNIPQN